VEASGQVHDQDPVIATQQIKTAFADFVEQAEFSIQKL
jgi:hypothetical protein